jgi:16S rRNA (cytosine967-C5)-methyltransferase
LTISKSFAQSANQQSTPSKVHRHMVEEIVSSLQLIFGEDVYADKVVEKNLKFQKKWGARDRRFYAENVYECVRWWRKLWFVLGEEPDLDSAKLIQLWAVYQHLQGNALPDWPELEGLTFLTSKISGAPLEVQESITDWMQELGKAELGERWPAIMKSLNQKAPVDLRVNTLKSDRESVKQNLHLEGIASREIAGSEEGLELLERKNVFISKTFLGGAFEVQDRASQRVARLLDPQPGERVVDACAGAGGKTLHLAARMKNKGRIIALDIHERKLKELLLRARRNGVSIIETRWIESSKVIKRLHESADALLLDVPCSGIGVLRRNPDTKWKLNEDDLQSTRDLQREILQSYSKILRQDGRMVYATCSSLPSENEEQVQWFLRENPNWKLVEQLRIDPDQGEGDGFFAALMRRT